MSLHIAVYTKGTKVKGAHDMNCTHCNEILEGYEVEDGIIRSAGQFEGEPIYTVHFGHIATPARAF